MANEETNALITTFLSSLAGFQLRAKEKEPAKAKLKLRYAVGMKQVINSIKAGKARLVLLAPDTEQSEVVDSKIAQLLQAARDKEVPCLYCLSRRRLAKAAGLSMR